METSTDADNLNPSSTLPTWLKVVATFGICVHFLAVIATVLAAPSGPWPSQMEGAQPAHAPFFAEQISNKLDPWLSTLKLSSNFHFNECRPTISTRFEAVLRDELKNEIKRLKFPEETSMPSVRHRHLLLSMELSQDEPLEALAGEWVPSPGKEPRQLPVWRVAEGSREGALGTIAENVIPRDRPIFAPSQTAQIAARSYSRFLCREHHAATCEIVRYTRILYAPMLLTEPTDPNPAPFEEESRSFGVTHAEASAK